MKQKLPIIIALVVMVGSALGILFYLHNHGKADRDFAQLKTDGVFDLLALHEQNPDMIGWIKIPDTGVDYPVMKGEFYLFKNFKKEYSESGTPFVMGDWDEHSRNSLIYGHNMWVQRTVFNPLHRYKDKDYWRKHKNGTFYVIREVSGEKYVEKRDFTISHVIKTSVKEDFLWQGYTNVPTIAELNDYIKWCRENHLYDTDMGSLTDEGLVSLCTCSYHISGDRHAGRLLVIGTITQALRED